MCITQRKPRRGGGAARLPTTHPTAANANQGATAKRSNPAGTPPQRQTGKSAPRHIRRDAGARETQPNHPQGQAPHAHRAGPSTHGTFTVGPSTGPEMQRPGVKNPGTGTEECPRRTGQKSPGAHHRTAPDEKTSSRNCSNSGSQGPGGGEQRRASEAQQTADHAAPWEWIPGCGCRRTPQGHKTTRHTPWSPTRGQVVARSHRRHGTRVRVARNARRKRRRTCLRRNGILNRGGTLCPWPATAKTRLTLSEARVGLECRHL